MTTTDPTTLKITNKRAQARIRKAARAAVNPLATDRAASYRLVRELACDAQWQCDAGSTDHAVLVAVASWAHKAMLAQHADNAARSAIRNTAKACRPQTAYEREIAYASALRSL